VEARWRGTWLGQAASTAWRCKGSLARALLPAASSSSDRRGISPPGSRSETPGGPCLKLDAVKEAQEEAGRGVCDQRRLTKKNMPNT
jgi:hypothetical protein